ncbi:hypothetical protein [Oceanobacillus sp. CFH 90083]|uniref:hypothetical protein n=1 Tax=Oceanobacillus sp. CFH 90083 TaxID=2592336 RepID=UPI00128C8F2B|nr:hypothetical protein [Oceanobacillus sp. CFH 90083]
MEIEEAMIVGNQAIVNHINDEAEASQQEREDFDQVLQLAVLDFQVEAFKLVNETDRVISIFPLLEEIDDTTNTATDDDNSSEDASNTEDEEENTEWKKDAT